MPDAETLRIVVIREGEMLVAQCLEHDICTQAQDMDELRERLDVLIDLEREESIERTGQAFGDIPPAPNHFHDMWKDANAFAGNNRPYNMALAA